MGDPERAVARWGMVSSARKDLCTCLSLIALDSPGIGIPRGQCNSPIQKEIGHRFDLIRFAKDRSCTNMWQATPRCPLRIIWPGDHKRVSSGLNVRAASDSVSVPILGPGRVHSDRGEVRANQAPVSDEARLRFPASLVVGEATHGQAAGSALPPAGGDISLTLPRS